MTVKKLDLVYEGKAKKVFNTEKEDYCVIEYKDDATAFNGVKKSSIAGKGVINNIMSSYFFKLLEENGIPTHFVEQLNEREMLSKKVEIVPLEVIVRNIAAGSISRRLGIPEGTELPVTVLEFSYKNDELGDPLINDLHAYAMELATPEEVEIIKKFALKINSLLSERLLQAKIKLVDFKLEFGKFNGEIILADEISPDTCRFWDLETGKKLDKDRFRFDLGDVEEGYQEALKRLMGGN